MEREEEVIRVLIRPKEEKKNEDHGVDDYVKDLEAKYKEMRKRIYMVDKIEKFAPDPRRDIGLEEALMKEIIKPPLTPEESYPIISSQEGFKQHMERCFERSRSVLTKKRKEYNGEVNVFHNFDDGVGLSTSNTNVGVAWGYLTKHLQSLKDIVRAVEEERTDHLTSEFLDEKFGDVQNYILLIEGMVRQKITK